MNRPSPWRPLRHAMFRSLWIATVASNIGTWLQSVGAAWLMTSLSPSAVMVALVQAATSLPMFLLSLPAGALADVVDRRRILLVTQSWMTLAAAGLSAVTFAHRIGPWSLLLFTTLLGLGAALNQPAWQAIIPEIVPREDLPAAISLGSVGFNLARAAGPAIGGLLVAAAGAEFNFLLNALSFLGVLLVLFRWKRPPGTSVLPAERFFGAMRTGVRYVRHSPEVLAVVARGAVFVTCASSLWAFLPLVAKNLGQGPGGYGLLLAALGIGAVAGAFVLPRLNRSGSTDVVVAVATLVFAGGVLALGYLKIFWLLFAAMLLAGGAWLSLLSSLNVAIQTLVPSWVRGRALSVYMLFIFGGLAGGSALWGAVADRIGIARALLISAIGLVVGLLATFRIHLRSGEGLNLAPSRQWPAPRTSYDDLEPDQGPILVLLRYRIDPGRAAEFAAVMDDLRRVRLRAGALQWGLFSDAADPGRYTEMFLMASWMEHLRHRERVTVADEEVRRRAGAFHLGPEPQEVEHLVGVTGGEEAK
ncbi:MAG TPA: MFS transporter [Thermoanaerobaculia bacterium]|nr:MFS transporter [Thermoanaerobaculia bacterium]